MLDIKCNKKYNMGNKIITEADFWICDTGAVPAQLQGSNESVKTPSGEKYITIKDTASSSWIDFGCTKLMLIYAVIAAAAVVIGALIVGTGGTALIALGAVAGLAGAAWGAVVGSLLCGQLAANARKWVGGKHNYLVQGMPTITGDHQMKCPWPLGGTIKYAPNIKSWTQALALATSNYVGKLMEGMMVGAAIGMAGMAWAGGAAAIKASGLRGLGRAVWELGKSLPKNFYVNALESVSKFGLAMRGVAGVQNTLGTYGHTGKAGFGDFLKGTVSAETGAYDSAKLIYAQITGGVVFDEKGEPKQATWQDYLGIVMMFAPVGQAKRDVESQLNSAPETVATKIDDVDNSNLDDVNATKNTNFDTPETQKQNGEAFAEAGDLTNKQISDITENEAKNKLISEGYTDIVQIQNRSGHGIDVIGRNPDTGDVKCVEVKSNSSTKNADQQKGGEYFVNDRLRRAISEEKFYKIPPNPPELKDNAIKAQEWLDNAENVKYEEWRYKINRTTGEIMEEPKVLNW